MAGRTRIKICGVRDAATARAAAEAGADMVGLVFAEGSPRLIEDVETARSIASAVGSVVEVVGLFVNRPADEVRAMVEAVGLSLVQLHGDEDAGYAASLSPVGVLRSVAFAGRESWGAATAGWRDGPGNVRALLVDAPPPADHAGDQRGGHGRAVDWADLGGVLSAEDGGRGGLPPVMLAGGLTAENVGGAIDLLRPWGVDVSSGVERSRGVKDVGLIRAFCAAVRSADARAR